jgi:pyruvate-formate lyase-activating enzyme
MPLKRKAPPKPLAALVANESGEVFDLDGYGAVGMSGVHLCLLTTSNTQKMPYGGEIMRLPGRKPLVFNLDTSHFETLAENPYLPGEPIFPVAAFNSPGYLAIQASAYTENEDAACLPLFSYGALGWGADGFRSAVILVDSEKRQDLRYMKSEDVRAGIDRIQKKMAGNRLFTHLVKCALVYGCPAAKNFFLGRYEAPLPTAVSCNARCMGCLSLQTGGVIRNSQERIDFTPSADEIFQVAHYHIQHTKKSIVSFGQGCEGDPLMAAHVIEPAIRLIRTKTAHGTINMNTNGSRPKRLKKLLQTGLDSIRISLNSVREPCYHRYFQPNGYSFSDVLQSIDLAIGLGKYVAINYLNCPGFTDTPEEFSALQFFLKDHPVQMVQWRNLNYDPLKYLKAMEGVAPCGPPLGMASVLRQLKNDYPRLKHGYFNPPKEHFLSGPD